MRCQSLFSVDFFEANGVQILFQMGGSQTFASMI